jgi:hypothetical protein
LCIVQAYYHGGFVKGSLSCSRSVKKHDFEYKQLTRKVLDIKEELERLYFDKAPTVGKAGKSIKLQSVPESEWPLNPKTN